jgi:general secretion pathway protein H
MNNMRLNRGFTLIEIAVVMLVIVIVLGIVSVNLEPDRDSIVRDEANRLALLLQTAQQESILQGKVIGVVIERQGYFFMVLDDKGEFKPLSQDDVLYPRPLPSDIAITSVEIDGAPEETDKPRLILLPTGELTVFTVILSRGATRWLVKGELTGEITAQIAPAIPANG